MKITLITVAYNSASTIGATLDSVAVQTHPDIEHIVIDGASTDGTVDLVRRRGTRVAQVLSERDDGIYDAMNKGLQAASGDLVGFLNADDMLADSRVLADLAALADAEPAADLFYGDLAYVSHGNANRVLRHWRSGLYAASRLRFGWMPPHPTFYVRRDRLARIGRFDASLRIAADYDFMLRCLGPLGLRPAYLPRVLVHMRAGGASNRSIGAMLAKSREDLLAIRRNRIGGAATLLCKNLRKLPQFLAYGRAPASATSLPG